MIDIRTGDCREILKTLPSDSIHCCVTSPPYFGLRNYETENQIGLEETPEEYVAKLVEVFQEVKRVLRPDGICWLNLGDSYNGSGKAGNNPEYAKRHTAFGKPMDAGYHGKPVKIKSLKPKDMIGIPWRVAFALQADGWWLRSDIIWAKGVSFCPTYSGNALPESVEDRPTKSHEYLFLLTKSAKYFYDQEAEKENVCEASIKRITQKTFDQQKGGPKDYGKGINPNRSARKSLENFADSFTGKRNLRTVWTVKTEVFRGEHFAVFPVSLVRPCIRLGTSEKGCCSKCGAPWIRIIEKNNPPHDGETDSAYDKGTTANRISLLRQAARERGEEYVNKSRTIGWKASCECKDNELKPCTVLDPFGGSGTTGLVSESVGRNSILIELNPKYVKLIRKRTSGNKNMFCS